MHFPAVTGGTGSADAHSRASEKGAAGFSPAGDGEGDGFAKVTGSNSFSVPAPPAHRLCPTMTFRFEEPQVPYYEKSLPTCIPVLKNQSSHPETLLPASSRNEDQDVS